MAERTDDTRRWFDEELNRADLLLQAALDCEDRAFDAAVEKDDQEMQERLSTIKELLTIYRDRVNRIIETKYSGRLEAVGGK